MEEETEVMFDKVHAARLTRLAEALENQEPEDYGLVRFDFGVFMEKKETARYCGTVGCALGACPAIFPDEWEVRDYYDSKLPSLKSAADKPDYAITYKAAEQFFGLEREECRHLFDPDGQLPSVYGGRVLGVRATAKQVAANIRAFLAIKGEKAIQEGGQ